MNRFLIGATVCMLLLLGTAYVHQNNRQISGAPPYGSTESEAPEFSSVSWLIGWKRPQVPPTVALQVGHWNSHELPDELSRIRGNTGSSGGGNSEWEVNFEIATRTASILEEHAVSVDILPATVPPSYWADVFIAIHADGSEDASNRGFKIARPWRDFTNKADRLVSILEDEYVSATGFPIDPNITRNMRGYYAFSWWRYTHAIHPMTTAAIVETGFLTNWQDREIIVKTPDVSAYAIAQGILLFLQESGLLDEQINLSGEGS